MKKVYCMLLLCSLSFFSLSQWTFKKVNNDFDEPYMIAFTQTNNGAWLKLEALDNKEIAFYIKGGYYCDETVLVDFVFMVNGQPEKYSLWCPVGSKSDAIFFTFDLANSVFFNSFLKSSVLKIRVTEDVCKDEYYTFSMTNSRNAYNFLMK